MSGVSLKNFPLTHHELTVKQMYEENGYCVYPTQRLFGGMPGLPDFWITTTSIPHDANTCVLSFSDRTLHRKRTQKTGSKKDTFKTKRKITPNDGFFVECKGGDNCKLIKFSSHQRRIIPKLERKGYTVVIESLSSPEKNIILTTSTELTGA